MNTAPSGPIAGIAAAVGEPFPGRGTAWFAVGIFLILQVTAYLDRQVITLLVEPIKHDLGVSDFQIGLLQGLAFVLFYTLFAVPIGWMVDRYPRRPIVFTGMVIWSIAATACGMAQQYWQLLLARIGVGAGEAALAPSAYSIMADLFPKDRLAGALAVYSTGAIIGGAISLWIGGAVVGLATEASSYTLPLFGSVRPWQLVFIVTGLPGVLLAFLVFAVREPKRRGKMVERAVAGQPKAANVLGFMGRQRGFYVAHFVGFTLFNLLVAGYLAWIPTHMIRHFAWPVTQVGFVLGTQTLICGTIGMLGSGYVVDAMFRRGIVDAHMRYFVVGVLIVGVSGVVATVTSDVRIALAAMSLMKLITPFIAVAAAALQITTPNQYRGQVSALFLLIYSLGGTALGPAVMAGISDFALGGTGNIGMGMAITFAVISPLAAIAFAYGCRPMRRAVAASESWAHA